MLSPSAVCLQSMGFPRNIPLHQPTPINRMKTIVRWFRLNGSRLAPIKSIHELSRSALCQKLPYKAPDLPSSAGIEFIAQGDKSVPLLTIDPDDQLAVFFAFLFSLLCHTVSMVSIRCIYNVYTKQVCQYNRYWPISVAHKICVYRELTSYWNYK